MGVDGRLERAKVLYERAVFGGDAGGLEVADRELNSLEADLALARGRVLHARFLDGQGADDGHGADDGQGAGKEELALFERAAELYRLVGDVRGEGEALFWVGVFHQVVRRDQESARPVLERSHELAAKAGDKLTLSYALRHLGIAEHVAGRLETARERLEESVRLRRELGFLAGVAANLVGLAYIAIAEGRRDDAVAVLDEAAEIAETNGAAGVMRSIEEARETALAV
ncbi:tetratricopeptide repeat protein [Nonomuraea sp. NPDC049695]|uniref:tetratricopeptide repeat protein n=1 Tax=Nonomuraea sp. NPDC049695 TaxID=3154734 RepID=UPI00341C4127